MSARRPVNPFYLALVLAGLTFGLTALAYGVMCAIAHRDPEAALESIDSGRGLVALMDRHGFHLMMMELVILAVTTVLAITTDGYWTSKYSKKNVSPERSRTTNRLARASEKGANE